METDVKALKRFQEINRTYPCNSYIDEWKQNGGKVIGWLCSYVPEELIYAAGILPIRMTGYHTQTAMNEATAKMSDGICTFARSCLQLVLDKKVDYLDGFVGANCCDHTRRLTEFLDYHSVVSPFNVIINPPLKMTADSIQFYGKELREMKLRLEEFTGKPITDAALWDAIEIHNTTRTLVRRLYDLRKREALPIRGSDVIEVLNASFTMPKPHFNALLSQLLEELEALPATGGTGRPRLMLLGSPMTDTSLVKDIEALGADVVMEEMCTAGRHYWCNVDTTTGLSPMDALAQRYLTNFPCARMIPTNTRMENITESLHDWKVDGVISANVRFCTLYIHDIPIVRSLLDKAGYPLLELNLEYNEGGKGQFVTRIQAFREMLAAEGGKRT